MGGTFSGLRFERCLRRRVVVRDDVLKSALRKRVNLVVYTERVNYRRFVGVTKVRRGGPWGLASGWVVGRSARRGLTTS